MPVFVGGPGGRGDLKDKEARAGRLRQEMTMKLKLDCQTIQQGLPPSPERLWWTRRRVSWPTYCAKRAANENMRLCGTDPFSVFLKHGKAKGHEVTD
jgi:hypothetical protein